MHKCYLCAMPLTLTLAVIRLFYYLFSNVTPVKWNQAYYVVCLCVFVCLAATNCCCMYDDIFPTKTHRICTFQICTITFCSVFFFQCYHELMLLNIFFLFSHSTYLSIYTYIVVIFVQIKKGVENKPQNHLT